MKNRKIKTSISSFIEKQIKELNQDAIKSKKRYRIIALLLSFLNLSMIGIAAAAIELLVEYNNKPNADSSQMGVILTSCAAGLIVIMFVLQFVITIVRSKRKTDIYKDAFDEIQLEVMKFQEGVEEYSKKNKEKILVEKCKLIKTNALEFKFSKKTSSLVLKGLIGGEDV